MDLPPNPGVHDLAILSDSGERVEGRAGLEPTGAQMEEFDEGAGCSGDDLRGCGWSGGQIGKIVNDRYEVGLFVGFEMVVTVPGGHLSHHDPDDEEADRRLDVGTMTDREACIGLGEEEVEPKGCRKARYHSGDTVAQHRDAHDHRDEEKGGSGTGEQSSERYEYGRQDKRSSDGSEIRPLLLVPTKTVHWRLS
jgi:hypothetical protein